MGAEGHPLTMQTLDYLGTSRWVGMDVLVKLLYATLFLGFLAVTLLSLGMVGLAFRWVLQVWSGRGSHRPFDKDANDAPQTSVMRNGRVGHMQDEVDSREII
jgi:hypothetical protein